MKKRLLYSYAGILAAGAAVYALLLLLSLALGKGLLTAAAVLRIYLPLTALTALFFTVSGVSLLRHEGMRPRNLVGTALGLSWMAGNLLCLLLSRAALPGGLRLFAALLGAYVDLFLSGVLLMSFLAARHKPAYDKDFVIIPGCSISKKGGLLPLLKGRTNRAIRFAWDQEIATGLFAKKIIDEVLPEARICFVTTNYHVLRSGMLAQKAGLDAEGLASGTKWYFWPNGLAREIIAVISLYPAQQLAALGILILAALLA